MEWGRIPTLYAVWFVMFAAFLGVSAILEGDAVKRNRLLPAARSLFAQGHTPAEIAEALDVSAGTVRRWRREDDDDWGELQEKQRPRDIQGLMRRIEQQMDAIVADDSIDSREKADAISKLERSLDSMCSRFESLDLRLDIAEDMGRWAAENMSDADNKAIRRFLATYTAHLRWKYR